MFNNSLKYYILKTCLNIDKQQEDEDEDEKINQVVINHNKINELIEEHNKIINVYIKQIMEDSN